MKTKLALILVVLVTVFLGVALMKLGKQKEEQQLTNAKTISTFSNDLAQTSAKLEEERQVNITLSTNLSVEEKKVVDLTQNLKNSQAEIERVKADAAEAARLAAEKAKQAEEIAKALQSEIDRRAQKIAELEVENASKSAKLVELTNQLVAIEGKIAETERRLASSEGDREFLLKELKRMMAEKSELEKQFNNLVLLREQMEKLKEEQAVVQRMENLRHSAFSSDGRGASMLQWGFKKSSTPTSSKGSADLNVELHRNAPAKVTTPDKKK